MGPEQLIAAEGYTVYDELGGEILLKTMDKG